MTDATSDERGVGREWLVHAVDEFIQAHDRDPRTAPTGSSVPNNSSFVLSDMCP